MLLPKNQIKFQDNRIAFAEDFNVNLRNSMQDINDLILRATTLEEDIYRYIGIYNEDYIEQLRYKLQRIKNQIDAIKLLSSNNKNSNIYNLNLSNGNNYLPYSALVYRDPKTNSVFNENALLSLDPISSSLTNKTTVESTSVVSDISAIIPISLNNKEIILDNKYDLYILNTEYQTLTFDVIISLGDSSSVNSIYFDSISKLPFNIDNIYLNTGSWVDLHISKTGIFGAQNFYFGLTANVTAIKLTISLPYSKATNRYIDSTGSELLNQISTGSILFNNLASISDESLPFAYFVYHFGLQNISIQNINWSNSGVYISDYIKAVAPAHFTFDSTISLTNMSAEYYLIKSDFDSEDNRLDETILSLNLDGSQTISNEVIIPVANSTFSDTIIDENDEIDGNTIYKVAKLSFTPDKDESIVVLADGSSYSNTNYYIFNNYLYFKAVPVATLYTITYSQYSVARDFLTPALTPESSNTKIVEVTHDYGDIIKFKDDNGTPTELPDNTTDPDAEDYLKIILPYDYDTTTITIQRYVDGILDESAPIYYLDGVDQNVFFANRKLYLPFNSILYPKLYNTTFKITGVLNDGGFTEDIPYFYNQDGSLIINWEYFKNIETEDYAYTLFNLMIIGRQNSSSDSCNLNIRDIYLYYNTFNDLTTTVV